MSDPPSGRQDEAAPSTKHLLDMLRLWVVHSYPGATLDYVKIHLLLNGQPLHSITLPGSPATGVLSLSPRTPEPVAVQERLPPGATDLHPCIEDILKTLEEVGRPLTEVQLRQHMARNKRSWSESSVKRYLKVLIEDGAIENPENARPRGYRLTTQSAAGA